MKFILEDNEGKHTIKFEKWQLKPNNVIWFKNCISRDLGKLLQFSINLNDFKFQPKKSLMYTSNKTEDFECKLSIKILKKHAEQYAYFGIYYGKQDKTYCNE